MPQVAHSSSETKGCHCFRNRTFNTEDRFASDDYLLTTTFNSMLASEFNISKRQIIMMKMREGVANDVLVTALYLSREIGLEISQLLKMRKKQSWQQIINQLKTGKTSPDTEELFLFITTGASDDQIAEYIINLMIISRFSLPQESLALLKNNDLNSREIILANTLAGHSGTSVLAIANQYRKNRLSWSEIAHNFGMEPADVGKLLEPAATANE
jgi:hypothetical protein